MNRLCIFAHYDKHNIIDEYVVEYIKGLATVSKQIIFVSSCEISYAEVDKVSQYCTAVLQKANEGYDFGSWKFGMEYVGFDNLANFDEVILANDSCFGPIFPFSEMFDNMSTNQCDVWGGTIGGGICKHLQSYFLVCRPKLLKSQCFVDFFKSVTVQKSKSDYIIKYEIGFSKMVIKNGYSFDAYFNKNTIKISIFKFLCVKIPLTIKHFFKPNAIGRPNLLYKFFVMLRMVFRKIVFNESTLCNPSLLEIDSCIKNRVPLIKKMLFDKKNLTNLTNFEVNLILSQNVEQLVKENSDYNFDIIQKYNDRILK